MSCHSVGCGGIETVVGKETSRVFQLLYYRQRTEHIYEHILHKLNIVAYHEYGNAFIQKLIKNISEYLLIPASMPLVGSSKSNILGSKRRTLAKAARCCSPPDKS